jgi:hypothetical protein
MRPDAAERAMRVVDARLWWRAVVPETFAHTPPPCLPAQSALSIKDQRDGFVHFCKLFNSLPYTVLTVLELRNVQDLDSWRSDTPDAPGTFGIHRTPTPDRQAGPFRLVLLPMA